MFHFDLNYILFNLLAFLAAIAVHEAAHAWVAYLWGDDTGKRAGRITLNPVPHVDLLGMLLILFGPFGWAKPTPINAFHFRNKRLALITVIFAGPFANFLLAVLVAFVWRFAGASIVATPGLWSSFLVNLLNTVIYLNIVFAIFNLVPIPPLDGGRIVQLLMPRRYTQAIIQYNTYGPFLLFVLVLTPLGAYLLSPLMHAGSVLVQSIAGM